MHWSTLAVLGVGVVRAAVWLGAEQPGPTPAPAGPGGGPVSVPTTEGKQDGRRGPAESGEPLRSTQSAILRLEAIARAAEKAVPEGKVVAIAARRSGQGLGEATAPEGEADGRKRAEDEGRDASRGGSEAGEIYLVDVLTKADTLRLAIDAKDLSVKQGRGGAVKRPASAWAEVQQARFSVADAVSIAAATVPDARFERAWLGERRGAGEATFDQPGRPAEPGPAELKGEPEQKAPTRDPGVVPAPQPPAGVNPPGHPAAGSPGGGRAGGNGGGPMSLEYHVVLASGTSGTRSHIRVDPMTGKIVATETATEGAAPAQDAGAPAAASPR